MSQSCPQFYLRTFLLEPASHSVGQQTLKTCSVNTRGIVESKKDTGVQGCEAWGEEWPELGVVSAETWTWRV